jgi:transmembrane sensor
MKPADKETSADIAHAAAVWAVKERPLSPEDQAALDTWLAGDRRRQGALFRAESGWASLSRARALDGARRGGETARLWSRRGLLVSAGLAGTMAAGIGGAILLLNTTDHRTQVGEFKRLPLADGTVANLNTDSEIRVNMHARVRQVELARGEAWFEVAKDPSRPFVVRAGDTRVQAVGTAFSVRHYAGGAEIMVTEGRVKAWAADKSDDVVWLAAGDRTFINGRGALAARKAPEEIDKALAWRSGQIVFEGQTLDWAVAEYNRYNTRKIVLDNPELKLERLVGKYSTGDPVGFAQGTALSIGAEVSVTPDTIHIRSFKKGGPA